MPPAGPAPLTAALPHARPFAGPRLRWTTLLVAGGLLLPAQPAMTQGTAANAAGRKAPAAVGKTAKAAGPRQKLSDQAKGLALASATTEAISAEQLDIATRVLTGQADCEFRQTVRVLALPGKPGLFTVEHLGKRFVMAPRETSTGAVRLEDPSAGVVWLQIPAKSMLMNARIGQRMVDSCLHAEQRGALLAAADPAQTLGIVPRDEVQAPTLAIDAAPVAPGSGAAAAAPAAVAASAALAGAAAALPPAQAASAPAVPSACIPAAPAPALPPVAPASAPFAESAASAAVPAASP